MRVYELAKELGIPNKELIEQIKLLGLEVNNHMSTLARNDVAVIRRAVDARNELASRAETPNYFGSPSPKYFRAATSEPRVQLSKGKGRLPSTVVRSTRWETERSAVLPPESEAHRQRVSLRRVQPRVDSTKKPQAPNTDGTGPLVLDGSNIAYWAERKKFSLLTVLALCSELQRRSTDFVCFFDATARHRARESEGLVAQQLLEELFDKGSKRFVQSVYADSGILRFALRHNSRIVSRDRYNKDEQLEKFPFLRDDATRRARVISGDVVRGVLLVDQLDLDVEISETIESYVAFLMKAQD
ncbi:MAG: translation initiation factor IF-2 N-terminal domain-containing protein [Kofleriaceae bacterium]